MKNSNDTIGNRTRDLPACSAMPRPTAPPRTPHIVVLKLNYLRHQENMLVILSTSNLDPLLILPLVVCECPAPTALYHGEGTAIQIGYGARRHAVDVLNKVRKGNVQTAGHLCLKPSHFTDCTCEGTERKLNLHYFLSNTEFGKKK